MKIELTRLDDSLKFRMTTPQGHEVITDASPDDGGHDEGARPTELLLMALASCSSIDVVLILKKMKLKLEDIKVDVDGEKDRTQIPALFRKIHAHYKLYGNIPIEKAERAVELSMEKYCSVTKTLEKIAEITYSVEVLPVQ